MRKTGFTEAEVIYREFDRKRRRIIRCLSIALLVIVIAFFISLRCMSWTFILLIATVVCSVVYVIVARVTSKLLYKKQQLLYANAYGEQKEYVRTGIFKELWDEYEYNDLESLVASGKIVFLESYNNCIEIVLEKRKREFIITLDENEIVCLTGMGTEHPTEKSIPLTDVQDKKAFFDAVSSFVAENC